MSNTSATGGYLQPISPLPTEDDNLEDQLQAVVVGITALDGAMVRPRWQATPPKQPAPDVNWCAIGVIDTQRDTYAAVIHHSDGQGADQLLRSETIEVMASFYGPSSKAYAGLLSDGLQIPQNREAMWRDGLALVETGDIVAMPALVNTQWLRRHDLKMTLRRQIARTYAVLNLLSAEGAIKTETSSQDWQTPQEN